MFAAFLSSSIPSGSHELAIGSQAPAITLAQSSHFDSTSLKGSKILVNFWSASDPASRIANKTLSRMAMDQSIHDTRFISICIDEDSLLASEIAKIDGISEKVISLNRDDIAPDVLKDFQIQTGCRSYLIDSFGSLKAISSSPEMLNKILS